MTTPAEFLTVRERSLMARSEKAIYTLDRAFNPYVLQGLEQVMTLSPAGVVRRRGRIRILTKESQGEPIAWSIGQRIRAAREQKGWTQEDLANRTGIARANIARLESGRHAPKIETLRRVAASLKLDAASLLKMPDYRATAEDLDWLEAGMGGWFRSLANEDVRP